MNTEAAPTPYFTKQTTLNLTQTSFTQSRQLRKALHTANQSFFDKRKMRQNQSIYSEGSIEGEYSKQSKMRSGDMGRFLKDFIGATENDEDIEDAIRDVTEKVSLIQEKSRLRRTEHVTASHTFCNTTLITPSQNAPRNVIDDKRHVQDTTRATSIQTRQKQLRSFMNKQKLLIYKRRFYNDRAQLMEQEIQQSQHTHQGQQLTSMKPPVHETLMFSEQSASNNSTFYQPKAFKLDKQMQMLNLVLPVKNSSFNQENTLLRNSFQDTQYLSNGFTAGILSHVETNQADRVKTTADARSRRKAKSFGHAKVDASFQKDSQLEDEQKSPYINLITDQKSDLQNTKSSLHMPNQSYVQKEPQQLMVTIQKRKIEQKKPFRKIPVKLNKGQHRSPSLDTSDESQMLQSVNMKQFDFQPDSFFQNNIIEKIPRFLLSNGKQSLKKIIDQLKINPKLANVLQIRNDS